MTKEEKQIKSWFEKQINDDTIVFDLLSVRAIERAAKITDKSLCYFLKNMPGRRLNKDKIDKLLPIIIKLGFKQ